MEPLAPGGHLAIMWRNNSNYKANTEKSRDKKWYKALWVNLSQLVKMPLINKISKGQL